MANSPTQRNDATLDAALAGIPKLFRSKVILEFLEIRKRYSQAIYSDEAYDAIGLSAGKFCETMLRFLQHKLSGAYTPFGSQIRNYADECRKLEQTVSTAGVESLRVIIPRCLSFIYTIRNKRGIGHSGGDVEANRIDINTIVTNVNWITCELIRIHYGFSLEEAQGLVDALNERSSPLIWEVAGKRRVLKEGLTAKDKLLLLCYSNPQDALLIEDLFDWVEYSSLSMFRSHVVSSLHKEKLIEHNSELDAVFISPLGIKRVETIILKDQ